MPQEAIIEEYLNLIEDELRRALAVPHPSLARFYGMMHYHLGWTDESFTPTSSREGKRVRPVFCLLANKAAGGEPLQALPAAAAIEILHNFSLIHDDIQDDDRLRRHRPTVWAVWGQPHAINVGDGMFALAFLSMSRLSCLGVPSSALQMASLAFQEACLTLTEGQYLDMSFEEHFDVDRDDYLWMIHNKTASLLSAATRIGAIIAGADSSTVTAYRGFGAAVGMAFQIRDDILGIWGDQNLTGKPAASDIVQKKKSLPLIYASETLRESGQEEILSRLAEIYTQPTLDAGDVEEVLEILETAGALQRCEDLAQHYQQQAMDNLQRAGDAPGSDHGALLQLRELSLSLLERSC